MTRKIAIATGSRAERALLQPIFDKLREVKEVTRWWFPVPPGEGTLLLTKEISDRLKRRRPDVILIPADRVEMVPVAMLAHSLKIPIFHMWAGVGSTGTYDDLYRRIISNYAHILLCEDKNAKFRLRRSGEESSRIFVVGSTHADSLIIDEKLAPLEPFDLVLLNGNPGNPKDELMTLKSAIESLNAWKRTIWIEPSTGYQPGMTDWIRKILPAGNRVTFMQTLPRPVFLGLMKKCDKFISNSSSAIYEAPLVGAERRVINPGSRNADRMTESMKLPPAAEKVVDLLVNYGIEPGMLLKRYGARH